MPSRNSIVVHSNIQQLMQRVMAAKALQLLLRVTVAVRGQRHSRALIM